MVGNDQLTIVFHVDDLKCSCCNQKALDKIKNRSYRNLKEMYVGDVHDYLGLQINYLVKSKVIFTMHVRLHT